MTSRTRRGGHRPFGLRTSRAVLWLLVVVALALVLAACSSGDDDSSTGEADTDSSEDETDVAASDSTDDQEPVDLGEATIEEVYAQLEGLEGDARTEQLIELANENGNDIQMYTSNTAMRDFANDFHAAHPELEPQVSVFRALANVVLQRILEEGSAGFQGADLTEGHTKEMNQLSTMGLLADLESPILDERGSEFDWGDWAGHQMTTHIVAWNTDLVGEEDAPTSYLDLVDERWEGELILETRTTEWLEMVWTYLSEEEGMSEEEIEEYFRTLSDYATPVTGHTNVSNMLATGEASIAVGTYIQQIYREQQDGAPVGWEPMLEPTIIVPTGTGILRNARQPAGALLFLEWFWTDGAKALSDQYRVPPSDLVEGGKLADMDYRIVDPAEMTPENVEFWRDRYERILQGQPLN